MPSRFCVMCGNVFEATRAWHKYCSPKCKNLTYQNSKEKILHRGRYCKQCGNHFYPDLQIGKNKQHCSVECSAKSARESRSKFWEKFGDKKKEKMNQYYTKSRQKCGSDGNLKRFYLRFPDAPRSCQSCEESRVLDIAHKPEFSRNGSWRSVRNTTLEKVWILCPTCHALIDRKGYNPSSLGLS